MSFVPLYNAFKVKARFPTSMGTIAISRESLLRGPPREPELACNVPRADVHGTTMRALLRTVGAPARTSSGELGNLVRVYRPKEATTELSSCKKLV